MVKELVSHRELADRLGREAYRTITGLWNAEHAAAELIRFCGDWMKDRRIVPAKEGPLSAAEVISPGWK